eukprot:CAMPEP_0206225838 /NCGR_PEP_ID=MMETSP0047_2-20121206/7758_1 /ASSEMBLY_ACC=CAM_ASM_000192 /TAXON_ID=195065 /ORGANISM="Chroomonas mesostigmatica_cf, Strain CCMP1168" /LENGTH=54 /DNA_ID=CAMNT_0053648859 /DNA_START=160 /DNA_END=324 /DNA_ORIENTATION=+
MAAESSFTCCLLRPRTLMSDLSVSELTSFMSPPIMLDDTSTVIFSSSILTLNFF